MANIHTYFSVERQNISVGNWAALQALFEGMGTQGSRFPMYNNHKRTRLDGDAVIYESLFDTSEVSLEAFKQLLADEFGVDVGDIDNTQSSTSYGGGTTVIWQFAYNAIDRFKVGRFGGGGATWQQSRSECLGYLAVNAAQWEPEL